MYPKSGTTCRENRQDDRPPNFRLGIKRLNQLNKKQGRNRDFFLLFLGKIIFTNFGKGGIPKMFEVEYLKNKYGYGNETR